MKTTRRFLCTEKNYNDNNWTCLAMTFHSIQTREILLTQKKTFINLTNIESMQYASRTDITAKKSVLPSKYIL